MLFRIFTHVSTVVVTFDVEGEYPPRYCHGDNRVTFQKLSDRFPIPDTQYSPMKSWQRVFHAILPSPIGTGLNVRLINWYKSIVDRGQPFTHVISLLILPTKVGDFILSTSISHKSLKSPCFRFMFSQIKQWITAQFIPSNQSASWTWLEDSTRHSKRLVLWVGSKLSTNGSLENKKSA